MDIPALLKKLSHANGISGHEAEVRAIVLDEFGRFAHETRVDKIGNALAIRRGRARSRQRKPRRIMLASHMDEIGLMVAGLNRGFLQVTSIGGVDARVLPGQEVIVHSHGRDLPGIVASVPPHLLKADERGKVMAIDRLWIDLGLSAQRVERLVQIGDVISIRRDAIELKNSRMSGKAFDNRASIAAVAVCLEQLQSIDHRWDVIAVATVQEEIDSLGAATAAFGLAPDAAIAVDVTYARQSGTPDDESFPLGSGPTIGIGPNMHPRMTHGLFDAAQRIELEYHVEPMPGESLTDGWAIQVAREGIPTGIVEIPIRSMHTPVEIVAPKDIDRAGRLLAEFIGGLDEAFYRSLVDQD
jgi:endoglucanase